MFNQFIRYSPILKFIKENSLEGKKILEIGSGSQGMGKFINIKFDGVDETTADYSKDEKDTNKNMNFIKGNACDLPFEDNTYDFVFSLDMIEHIPNDFKKQAFENAIKVSKDKIIIAFPCGKYAKIFDYSFYHFMRLIKRGKKPGGWLEEHYHFGLPEHNEIEKILGEIQQEYNITWKSFGNANIFFWIFIIFFETISVYTSNMLLKLIKIYGKKYSDFRSILPYRKFYIIEKKSNV